MFARGPAITSGYHDDIDATKQAFDVEGYFNTGDLAQENLLTGDVMITGRSKDTIVLSNGENIAPQPIEDSLTAHDLIDQAMLVGQDEKYLTALLVLNPRALIEAKLIDEETGLLWEKSIGATPMTTGPVGDIETLREQGKALNANKQITTALLSICSQAHTESGNQKGYERVSQVILRLEPFCVPNDELTQTLKIKRNVVMEHMKRQIRDVYSTERR